MLLGTSWCSQGCSWSGLGPNIWITLTFCQWTASSYHELSPSTDFQSLLGNKEHLITMYMLATFKCVLTSIYKWCGCLSRERSGSEAFRVKEREISSSQCQSITSWRSMVRFSCTQQWLTGSDWSDLSSTQPRQSSLIPAGRFALFYRTQH